MLHDDNILPSVLPALEALNLLGISVFAVSGAVVAARHPQTFVTFIFFAVVTGVGGGTVRDLLLGAPVLWLNANLTLLICFLRAAPTWPTPPQLWNGRTLYLLCAVVTTARASCRGKDY